MTYRVLTCCLLAGFLAKAGLGQEATPTLSQSKQTNHSLMGYVRKNLEPEGGLVPLTPQERFRLYVSRTYGPGSILGAAAVGGFQQLLDTPTEWGRGGEGYRKRLTSAYATHVVQGTVEYGASALLHEDNRYRPSLETGFWRRTRHAIISACSSTDDAGHQHFSYSRVGGAGAAAFLRRTWQPSSTDGVGDAVAGFGIIISAQVGGNIFREFWPDLSRHFLERK